MYTHSSLYFRSEELSHRLHRLSRFTTLPTLLTLLSQDIHLRTHHFTLFTLHSRPNPSHFILDSLFRTDNLDAAVELCERWVLERFDLDELDRHAVLAFH